MQTAPVKASKHAPIRGVHEGYGFEASIHGYDITLDGKLIKIERSGVTAAVLTNAQRAKQWISNQITPMLSCPQQGWFD
jgi:hypothetical protein